MDVDAGNACEYGPGLPTFADLKKFLREEKPLHFQLLEAYLRNVASLVNDLSARLERSERPGAHEMENKAGEPVPALVRESEAAEPVPALAQGSLEEQEDERQLVPHEPSPDQERVDEGSSAPVRKRKKVKAVREIELRSRTIQVPIEEDEGHEIEPAGPEAFHVAVVEGLPADYQQMLAVPETDPYRVNREEDGSVVIGCGMCPKKFGTLKGWRIHAAKMHARNGFCHKCGYFVGRPGSRSAEELAATMELHSLEWCPMATKAVMTERAAKRRRLELVGRRAEAEHYYVRGAQ